MKMEKRLKLPVKEKFEYDHIPLNGNTLRDKYPDVPFKDEDISEYDYESYDVYSHIFNEFLRQYEVEDLCVKIDYGSFVKDYYIFGLKSGEAERRGIRLSCDNCFTLGKDGFEINQYEEESNPIIFVGGGNAEKNFEFLPPWKDSKMSFEINPDKSIADDYISFFVDQLFSEYSEDEVIFKHPNGCQYFTKDYNIHKFLDVYIRDKPEDCSTSLKIKKQDVVEPFKKYNDDYSVKRMPKKSKQITLEQMKMEFKAICNYVIKNNIKMTKRIYESELEEIFKGQNTKINIHFNHHTWDYTLTDYNPKKKEDQYIKEAKIYKKDNHIGSYESFDNVDKKIKDEILEFIVEKFGDDAQLDVMDKDLDYFAGMLCLDIHDNEELTREYFLYENSFDFGKYKISVNSSKYIKDQCICDLMVDTIDIYTK